MVELVVERDSIGGGRVRKPKISSFPQTSPQTSSQPIPLGLTCNPKASLTSLRSLKGLCLFTQLPSRYSFSEQYPSLWIDFDFGPGAGCALFLLLLLLEDERNLVACFNLELASFFASPTLESECGSSR